MDDTRHPKGMARVGAVGIVSGHGSTHWNDLQGGWLAVCGYDTKHNDMEYAKQD